MSNSLKDRHEEIEVTTGISEVNNSNTSSRTLKCYCARNRACLLISNCRHKNIVFTCRMTSKNREYFFTGATTGNIKQKFANHLSPFRNRDKMNIDSCCKLNWEKRY